MSEKRNRQPNAKSVIQEILGKRVNNLLPDKDKAAVMEWLLALPRKELDCMLKHEDTPAFAVKCIQMIKSAPLSEYLSLVQQYKKEQQ